MRRSPRDGVDLREAIEVAIDNLEDERLHASTRISLALAVLRRTLLLNPRRDSRSRTRSTD